jgi:predicted nuclease of restriction endonuclease-like (RecB) superfamily
MKDTYYDNIKELLINNEITKRVKDYSKNKSDLETYYNVGKMLSEAGKHYGEGIIKKYSFQLSHEINKKYSLTTLKYMRLFYYFGKSQQVADQLSWSHYIELMPLKDINKINYYINQCTELGLSRNDLRSRIKSKEYERLPIETKEKIVNKKEANIIDYVKNPIIIKNSNYNDISEKVLQRLILEDIPSFLKELGNGFTFIDNEYKIKIGNRYNYIDLLLYNINYNCYVVIELKVTELKKEHIGQIQVYMNYIDEHLKKDTQNDTIGILLVKENNGYVLYYSDGNIIPITFELKNI